MAASTTRISSSTYSGFKTIETFTTLEEEAEVFKMYQKLTAKDKRAIVQARKFPKKVMDSFDLFKTYFLSKEGLSQVMAKLSQKEIAILHILHFNQWIVNASVFEGIYVDVPRPQRYYSDRRTFTQRYAPVIKKIQSQLVQKGVLIQYENNSKDTKAEKQRYVFPPTFAPHLPAPFFHLKTFEGSGLFNDEQIRRDLLQAIQHKPQHIILRSKKLYIGKTFFNTQPLNKIRLKYWSQTNGALILKNQFMEEGKIFSDFILHHLKQLNKNQWFEAKSISALLEVWDDSEKRKHLNVNQSIPKRYEEREWCEKGWQCGILQKRKEKTTTYYRLSETTEETIIFESFLKIDSNNNLSVDFKSIPFEVLSILVQVALFEPKTTTTMIAQADLVHMPDVEPSIWTHPLITWLEKNVHDFKKAFDNFHKNYGKQLIHHNLLVAKITNLSLRVSVEKALQKNHQVVVLSDEYIAFPKNALDMVERIVNKNGHVVKRK